MHIINYYQGTSLKIITIFIKHVITIVLFRHPKCRQYLRREFGSQLAQNYLKRNKPYTNAVATI